jgi:hypothetical protein
MRKLEIHTQTFAMPEPRGKDTIKLDLKSK